MADNAAQAANAQENAANATTTQANASAQAEGQASAGKPTDAEAKLIKEVMQLKKQLKGYETQQSDAEAKALAEQGKYKELADKHAAKADALAQRAIRAELIAHLPGLIKPDLVKLVDVSALKIGDDGSIDGIEDIAATFKQANPEYFATATTATQVPGTPKPATTAAGGPATFQEWEALPAQQRAEWASKYPDAFKRLCDNRKQSLTRN